VARHGCNGVECDCHLATGFVTVRMKRPQSAQLLFYSWSDVHFILPLFFFSFTSRPRRSTSLWFVSLPILEMRNCIWQSFFFFPLASNSAPIETTCLGRTNSRWQLIIGSLLYNLKFLFFLLIFPSTFSLAINRDPNFGNPVECTHPHTHTPTHSPI